MNGRELTIKMINSMLEIGETTPSPLETSKPKDLPSTNIFFTSAAAIWVTRLEEFA